MGPCASVVQLRGPLLCQVSRVTKRPATNFKRLSVPPPQCNTALTRHMQFLAPLQRSLAQAILFINNVVRCVLCVLRNSHHNALSDCETNTAVVACTQQARTPSNTGYCDSYATRSPGAFFRQSSSTAGSLTAVRMITIVR